jgi:hypothetical protein
MKRIVFILSLLTVSIYSFSQVLEDESTRKRKDDEIRTLIEKSDDIGGYGGLSVLYSQIDAKDAFVFGARGGLIMGHIFTLGIAGTGFINDSHLDNTLDRNVSLAGGYGGMFFEPIIFPKAPVHISVPVLIGIGGVAYTSVEVREWENDYFVEDSETFLVVEPGIEMEMNFTRFFRFSMGAYYRYTSEIELLNTDKDVLNGFSFGVNFKFGKF